jgi:hypothetical protein
LAEIEQRDSAIFAANSELCTVRGDRGGGGVDVMFDITLRLARHRPTIRPSATHGPRTAIFGQRYRQRVPVCVIKAASDKLIRHAPELQITLP